MNELRSWARFFWGVFILLAGWVILAALTYPILGSASWLVWPGFLVVAFVVGWRKARTQQRHIAHLAAEAKRSRKIADEAEANAARCAEEARIIRELADEGIKRYANPN